MSAPDDPVSMGPVMVAEGQTVSRGEFLPVRDLLLSLLAHRDEPFGRRLIAASAALDLLALYIPAAQQASQSAGQNASPVEAMGLFLQEMDAGGSDRLWSIAQKKISSPSAGKFCLVGVINGSHGAPSRSPTRAAWSLLALMGFSAANLAKVRFGPPPEPAFRVSQLLARRVDLDAPKPALVLEQRFLSLIKEGEWLDWEKTACWSFRRVVLLCGLIGWRAASLNEPGSDPAKLAAQAFAFVSERFGGPEGLEPAFHRWPVFEDSFRNWLKHTAFAPTMVELASKKS
jgi:hypothetical protein